MKISFNKQDIQRLLGSTIYRRAGEYHHRGCVEVLVPEGAGVVSAVVKGSGRKHYKVSLSFDRRGGLEDGNCNCPFDGPCKHIGATLLLLLERQAVEDAEPRFPQAEEREPTEPREETISLKDRNHTHNTFVLALGERSGSDIGLKGENRYRLIFNIEKSWGTGAAGNTPVWMLSPAHRFLRQDGSPGRIHAFYPKNSTEPVSEKEKLLLAALSQQSGFKAPLGEYLEYLHSDPPITLFRSHRGEVLSLRWAAFRRAVIRFECTGLQEKEPVFHPVVDFYDERGLVATRSSTEKTPMGRSPFFLVDEKNGVILFHSGDAPCDMILFSLLEGKQDFYFGDIRRLASYMEMNTDGCIEMEPPPQRVRIVRQRPVSVVVLDESRGNLQVDLHFRYGQQTFPFMSEESLITRESRRKEYLILRRDESYEEDRYWFLLSTLRGRTVSTYHPKNAGAPSLFTLVEDMAAFLHIYGEKLLQAGFELRWKGKNIRRAVGLSFTVSRHMDWLDLRTRTVSEDGEKHPLLIDPSLLGSSFVADRETYYLLGKDDLEKLRRLLGQGMDAEGRLKISRYNFSLVDELYEEIENKTDDDVRRMRETLLKLRDVDTIEKVKRPAGFRGKLRTYQRTGVNWLHCLYANGVGGCLADDMGLGKTVQTLVLLQHLKERNKLSGALIAAPLSTLRHWEAEAKRFTPGLRVAVHHGPGRAKGTRGLKRYDLIVTSYPTLRNDVDLLREIPFTYLILDEAQTIKNPSAQIHRCVRTLVSKHRLSLTGTPVENSTTELWAQMSFLNPGLLGSLRAFQRSFVKPIEEQEGGAERELLKKTVAPFILRRRKSEVLTELPPKEEILQYTEMGPSQSKVYEQTLETYRRRVTGSLDERGVAGSAVVIFEALLRLRQIAILPGMAGEDYRNVPSCKFELIKEILPEILAEGHKVLVFSQFLHSLAVLKEWIIGFRTGYCYLDGSTRNREAEIARFQSDPEKRVFLISLKAGGLGINLTAADYVILFDPWWNPAVEIQAVDRSHRIGQTKKVITYKLITRGTVEEKILKLQEKKKKLVEDIVTTERAFFSSLREDEVLKLFET